MANAQDTLTNISKYYKTFSGTDTLVFALFPGSLPVVLGSITTISYSCYRSKKPVVNLGRININGMTRGTRIFAGTMIFTLINQHWVRDLQEQDGTKWLKNYKDIKADELPLFDLMIISANEYGSYVYMYIYGVDFTDSAQTLSVEDLFTENTFSFVARDVQDFKAGDVLLNVGDKSNNIISGMSIGNTIFEDSNKEDPTLIQYKKNETKREENAYREEYKKHESSFDGEVHYSATSPSVGNHVGDIQANLVLAGYDTPITMIYDEKTKESVTEFQVASGYLDRLGVYDYKTHYLLMSAIHGDLNDTAQESSIVINRSGAYVYEHPTMNSNVTTIKRYNEQVNVYTKHNTCTEIIPGGNYPVVENGPFDYYKIKEGFILSKDVYNPFDKTTNREFPTIQENTYSYYIKILQDTLAKKYGEFEHVDGLLDGNTIEIINRIQVENNFEPTRYVDQEIWKMIIGVAQVPDDTQNKTSLSYKIIPGTYHINNSQASEFLSSITDITVNTSVETYVKISAVCIYQNEKKMVNTKTILVSNGIKLPDEILKAALSYHVSYGYPKEIKYFIYPYNQETYGWDIHIGGTP